MSDLSTHCPTCNGTIASHAIHVDSQIAMCVRCRISFRFRFALATDPTNALPSGALAPPRGVSVENDGHTLRVRYRWYDRWAYFWLAGAVLLTIPAIGATGLLHDDDKHVFMNWLVIVAAWIAVAIFGYVAACCFLTSTFLEADPMQLAVRTAPLPWLGTCRLPWNDIAAIECRFRPEHNPHDPNTATHQLAALMHNGKRRTLIGVFSTPEHSCFFAEQIEAFFQRHRR